MKISVLILTKNRSQTLLKTVQSVLAGTEIPYEIIIVDSSPNTITKELISAKLDVRTELIRYVRVPDNGINFSLNTGIKLTQGDVIAKIDDDEYADKTWLKSMQRTFKEYPHAAAVTGSVLPTSMKNYWNQVWYEILHDTYSYLGSTDFILGSNAGYRKEVFTKHKFYFNENMKGIASEDSFISYMLRKKKLHLVHDYRIKVYHDFRKTFSSFFRQWLNYGISDINLWKLYPEMIGQRHSKDVKFTLYSFLFALRKISEWKILSPTHRLICGLLLRSTAYLLGVIVGLVTSLHRF